MVLKLALWSLLPSRRHGLACLLNVCLLCYDVGGLVGAALLQAAPAFAAEPATVDSAVEAVINGVKVRWAVLWQFDFPTSSKFE